MECLDSRVIDEPNPITTYSYKLTELYRELNLNKEDPRMKKARSLWVRDAWLLNVYVVNDPVTPENNGTIKIIKIGSALHNIIMEHFVGERSDEFGLRILDLSPNGCNFKVCVKDNGAGFHNYDSSYFTGSMAIAGVSDNESKMNDILNNIHNLTTVYSYMNYEDMKNMLITHFIADDEALAYDKVMGNTPKTSPVNTRSSVVNPVTQSANVEEYSDDDVVYEDTYEEPVVETIVKPTVKPTTTTDDEIDNLLASMKV
jgi:hypothetical protein